MSQVTVLDFDFVKKQWHTSSHLCFILGMIVCCITFETDVTLFIFKLFLMVKGS